MRLSRFSTLSTACLLLVIHASSSSGVDGGNLPAAVDPLQNPAAAVQGQVTVRGGRVAKLKRHRHEIIISLLLSGSLLVGSDFVGSNWPRLFPGFGAVLFCSHLFLWIFVVTMGVWGWMVEREIAERSLS